PEMAEGAVVAGDAGEAAGAAADGGAGQRSRGDPAEAQVRSKLKGWKAGRLEGPATAPRLSLTPSPSFALHPSPFALPPSPGMPYARLRFYAGHAPPAGLAKSHDLRDPRRL